jgi:hypothetical protein
VRHVGREIVTVQVGGEEIREVKLRIEGFKSLISNHHTLIVGPLWSVAF